MALTAMAIGAALGLAKSELVDQPAAAKQRELAAATQKYSPWTGLKADPVANPNPFDSMLQYGSAGAMMGANIKAADKGSGNPWGSGGYGNQGINFNNSTPYSFGTSYNSPYLGKIGN